MATDIVQESEEYFEFQCSPCSEENRTVEAVTFCVECGYMCQKCLDDHNRFKSMRAHTMLDQQAMKSQGQQAPLSVPTEKCTKHHGRILDTYCGQHGEICCVTCISIDHRNCAGIDYLPHVSQGIAKSEEFKTLVASMTSLKSELKSIKKKRQEDAKQLLADQLKVKEEVAIIKNRIIKHIKQLEHETLLELDSKYAEISSRINRDVQNLQKVIDELDGSLGNLDASKTKNETKLFTCMKAGKKEFKTFEKSLEDIEPSIQEESLKFSIDSTLKGFDTNFQTMGTIYNVPLYKAGSQSMLDVNASGDKLQCGITHMCQMENGSIILVDSKNKSLKRLDKSYKVSESLPLPGKPVTCCCTETNQVAVSLVELNQIQFVTAGNSLTLANKFSVNNYCRGIACCGDKLFVSCGGGFRDVGEGPGQVRIYTKTGEMVTCIEQSDARTCLFSMPLGIAVSRYNTRVYVADRDNGLIVLDRYGRYLGNAKGPTTGVVTSVCVGNRNELFVCGVDSKHIKQLDWNWKPMAKYLINGKIEVPQTLLFDEVRKTFLVAGQGANAMVVMKLQ